MHDAYELIDAGDGRRLERFGPLVVDRPAPGAGGAQRAPELWTAALTYRAGRGWASDDGSPAPADDVTLEIDGVSLIASLAAGGQVGIFPEHARHADFLRAAIQRRATTTGEPPAVLNLFAYTGLLSLVAAKAGAAVTHVDASRPAVAWARRNAAASALDDRPIRWIVDDALDFVGREARRGRRYEGLILDPPSYGHGGKGHADAFRFDRDVDDLLEACRAVAAANAFWLLSTHTPGWNAERLASALADGTGRPRGRIIASELRLAARSGATLHLGAAARFDPLEGEHR